MVEVTVKPCEYAEIPGGDFGAWGLIKPARTYWVDMTTEEWLDIAERGSDGLVHFYLDDKESGFRGTVILSTGLLMRTSPVFTTADEAVVAATHILQAAIRQYEKLLSQIPSN